MEEIKFRYRLKNKETGDIIEQIYSISAIEHLIAVCPEPYEILSRDQYTGFKDKNDREIYNNDDISVLNGTDLLTVWFVDGQFVAGNGEGELYMFVNEGCEVIGD